MATEEREERVKSNQIPLGAPVKLVSTYYGWGNAQQGDFGIVTSRDLEHTFYWIYIPSKDYSWRGRREDLEVLEIDTEEFSDRLAERFRVGVRSNEVNRVVANLYRLHRTSGVAREETRKLLEVNIAKTQQELYSLHEELNWYNQIRSNQEIMNNESIPTDFSSFQYQANFVYYILNSCYEKIDILEDGKIVAITKPVELKWDNKIIPIGRYRVEIVGYAVRFEIITDQKPNPVVHGCIHPHIDSKGQACWGTWWGDFMVDRLRRRDYLGVLERIWKFLGQYHQGGWFHHVMFWHPEAEKLCRKCWNNPCNCSDLICVHCGLVIGKKCKCIRCPESNEIVGVDYDEYCREHCEVWDKKEKRCQKI